MGYANIKKLKQYFYNKQHRKLEVADDETDIQLVTWVMKSPGFSCTINLISWDMFNVFVRFPG